MGSQGAASSLAAANRIFYSTEEITKLFALTSIKREIGGILEAQK